MKQLTVSPHVEVYATAVNRLLLALAIGFLVAAVDIAAGTNTLDSTLVGGLSAVAVYIMATSLRRMRPVPPDRHFWISGVDGPPDEAGDDGDGDD